MPRLAVSGLSSNVLHCDPREALLERWISEGLFANWLGGPESWELEGQFGPICLPPGRELILPKRRDLFQMLSRKTTSLFLHLVDTFACASERPQVESVFAGT